jgi:hypothetical protein
MYRLLDHAEFGSMHESLETRAVSRNHGPLPHQLAEGNAKLPPPNQPIYASLIFRGSFGRFLKKKTVKGAKHPTNFIQLRGNVQR